LGGEQGSSAPGFLCGHDALLLPESELRNLFKPSQRQFAMLISINQCRVRAILDSAQASSFVSLIRI
jgi:hypothetical protein